jgi:3-dehydroquinate dehydratase-2
MLVGVLNGVNLNTLGRRDPAVYGALSLPELESQIRQWGEELGCEILCRQTNSEGEYVDWCQELGGSADGLIVNPGAWSHYSYAIHDALELARGPVVEVHLSDIESREEWRRHSVLAELVAHRVIGKGPDGYKEALEFLMRA